MNELLQRFSSPWILVGLVGQFLFFGRFVVQWIASEKRKESIIPTSFWYLSLSGGIFLLVYAIHIKDPVFIAGGALNLLIYTRNIMLIKNQRKL